ncbi:MAG: exo-alpha-sialidase [Candidatus Rokubacteria bacterium]|nr:exo-alpha-sialidase [Candidatus Rokubacteria bacterium]
MLLAVVLSVVFALGQAHAPGVTWGEKIEVASGGGYRGPWRMNESEYDYVDDPTVAINERGFVAVAWADQSRKDIFVQMYAPDGHKRLEEPVNVSRSPRIFSWLPRMLITSTDTIEVYILWQEIVFSGGSHGGEIFFARSTDGGKTISDPLNLSNDIAGSGKGRLTRRYWHNGSLDLAMGPEGNLYAAWTEYEGTLWFSRSTDRGRRFSRPVRIAGGGDATPARGPSLAVDARGDVYLAWTVGEDRAANIRVAKSTDGGRSFGAPRIVLESGGHADAPKIATDRKGAVHLAYAESPAGPFDRYRIHYTRSRDGGRAFEAPKEISSPHTEKFESVHFPALSVDGRDNLYVSWELFPGRRNYPEGLGFTYSRDGGRTFAPPTVIPGSVDPALGFNGSQQGLLMRKLAVNGAGAIAIVNSTFKSNERSRVWLFRGQAAGR